MAPPRPPKSLPGIHRPRAPEPPMMSAPLSPIQQRQQTHLRTNNHLHTHTHHQSNSNNGNNNVVNTTIRSSNNNSSLIRNNNINNNNNSNHSSSDVLSVHPVPITAPLIPLHQQQAHNISNSSLSSTTITSTNSFTRRRPLPPLLGTNNNNSNTLLPSISSNLVHGAESPVSPVTLAAPRPESERLANEYVDTPLRSHHHLAPRAQHPAGHTPGQVTTPHALLLIQQNERRQQQLQHSHPSHNQHSSNAISPANISLSSVGSGGGGGGGISGTSTLSHSNISSSHKGSSGTTTSLGSTQTTTSTTLLLPGQTPRQQPSPGVRPNALPIAAITKQPVSFSKDTMPASMLHDDPDMHHTGVTLGGDSPNSITCPRCNRCRCEQCQSPRKLPSRWVCNKTCLCSAEAVIDYASCLCCVKALFYHCAKDKEMEGDDGDIISCADDPCSCLPHKRAARWGWLGALSVVLPCLWCYWPMRGCVALCAKCYARHYRPGCRCQSSIRSTSMLAPISTTNTISAAKTADSGRTGAGGVTGHHLNSSSGITGSGHHHGSGTGRTIMRTSDLTPEKRLLDSSPEY